MTWAQFEEKQFEVAAAIELAHGPAGYGPVYSSGQVLEQLLGYDAAVAPPAGHVVWRILQVPRPRGVVLVQAHWESGSRPPASRLPTSPVSLIVQYKRPEYLYGARARQWRLWYAPYFRFSVDRRQQTVLLRLQRRLGTHALVRYASPAFWQIGDLDSAIRQQSVLEQTGFVPPDRLAGHRVWTYQAPGVDGLPNPRGRRSRFEALDQLLRDRAPVDLSTAARGEIVPGRFLEGHLAIVAEAAREREPRLRSLIGRWSNDLNAAVPELSAQEHVAVVDLATIVTVVSTYRASWHLI